MIDTRKKPWITKYLELAEGKFSGWVASRLSDLAAGSYSMYGLIEPEKALKKDMKFIDEKYGLANFTD